MPLSVTSTPSAYHNLRSRYSVGKTSLHISETQRPRRRKGDETYKVRKHRKTNALGSYGGWKDLGSPDEGRTVDELEQDEEEKDEDDTCGVATPARGVEIFPL